MPDWALTKYIDHCVTLQIYLKVFCTLPSTYQPVIVVWKCINIIWFESDWLYRRWLHYHEFELNGFILRAIQRLPLNRYLTSAFRIIYTPCRYSYLFLLLDHHRILTICPLTSLNYWAWLDTRFDEFIIYIFSSNDDGWRFVLDDSNILFFAYIQGIFDPNNRVESGYTFIYQWVRPCLVADSSLLRIQSEIVRFHLVQDVLRMINIFFCSLLLQYLFLVTVSICCWLRLIYYDYCSLLNIWVYMLWGLQLL